MGGTQSRTVNVLATDGSFNKAPLLRAPPRVLVTVPHAGCDYGSPVRQCDIRAKQAADFMVDALRRRGAEVSYLPNTTDLRVPGKRDYNRFNQDPDNRWTLAFNNEMQTFNPDWVLDMHSFPAREEWQSAGNRVGRRHAWNIAFLDLSRDSVERQTLAPLFNKTPGRDGGDDAVTWVPASTSNSIMVTARRDYGKKAILIEVDEDASIYPTLTLQNNMDRIAAAIVGNSK
jgi:hypothetical protein